MCLEAFWSWQHISNQLLFITIANIVRIEHEWEFHNAKHRWHMFLNVLDQMQKEGKETADFKCCYMIW